MERFAIGNDGYRERGETRIGFYITSILLLTTGLYYSFFTEGYLYHGLVMSFVGFLLIIITIIRFSLVSRFSPRLVFTSSQLIFRQGVFQKSISLEWMSIKKILIKTNNIRIVSDGKTYDITLIVDKDEKEQIINSFAKYYKDSKVE